VTWWEPSHVEPDEPEPAEYRLENALGTLTGKQRFVVELRFGLRDGEFYTFEEIAEAMGISVPMVWKHEMAALKKLRKTG
jgi:DNA-directed RNA polymerase sigma subunit (sigma70/sigma32)